jgi:hypothetical protein
MGRAKLLNLRGERARLWSEDEKEILRKLYPDKKVSINEICRLVNRSRYAVLIQAQYLGINRPVHDHEWTTKENNYLKKYYDKKSYKKIADHLGVTHSAVSHQVNRLGLKLRERGRLWTEEEKEFIRQNYKKIPTREIAKYLNRSMNSIINSAGPLGISAGRPLPWSEKEKEYMKTHYGHIPPEEISSVLGRSTQAVIGMAMKLKLTKRRKNSSKKNNPGIYARN